MKLYQEGHLKQMQMVHTLEDIIMAITGAETDIQVHEAVKAGTASLKSILSGIEVEEVENAMDELQEVMDSQSTIQDTLAAPGLENDMDLDELEAELSGIIAEQQEEVVAQEEPAHSLEAQLAALRLEAHIPAASANAESTSPIAQAGC